MRRSRAVLLLAIVAGGCVPRAKAPPRAPAATVRAGPVAYDNASRRICEARLSADGARFERVADRRYSSECAIVGGVHLTDIGMPVTNLGPMTCPLADALTRWTRDATQKAAVAWLDSPVVKIESFGTYSCRTMNNVPGARLSEHAHANAVDISGFVLGNGKRITVLNVWRGPDVNVRNFLHAVHDAGCRRFQVVLGPDANALHANHFHFDMGAGRACR